jgi:hypothetical protein
MWAQRQIVPQAHRYRLEMEAAFALLVVSP